MTGIERNGEALQGPLRRRRGSGRGRSEGQGACDRHAGGGNQSDPSHCRSISMR